VIAPERVGQYVTAVAKQEVREAPALEKGPDMPYNRGVTICVATTLEGKTTRARDMRCPFCGSKEDKVLDSRDIATVTPSSATRVARRAAAGTTTFEADRRAFLYVVKRGDRARRSDRGNC